MTNVEVITTAITATMFFASNQEKARSFLREHKYMTNMLSKSRFNRKLHSIPELVWKNLFSILSMVFIYQWYLKIKIKALNI